MSFVEGQFYHIYNRGSGRQPIFFEEENYRYLLRLFKKYTQNTRITVIAYCLMPNHYHFLVRQDGETSAGLLFQRVFNAYTKAINKKYDRVGTMIRQTGNTGYNSPILPQRSISWKTKKQAFAVCPSTSGS